MIENLNQFFPSCSGSPLSRFSTKAEKIKNRRGKKKEGVLSVHLQRNLQLSQSKKRWKS